jgi:quercetin dioxygenase-like cupin family protein
MTARSLRTFPVHLGLGAKAEPQPEFTGEMAWYEDYVARNADDGAEARIVALHDFTESWDSWEMHPEGDEVVACVSGSISLVQEKPDGSEALIRLDAGDYAINPAGVWHTADCSEPATVLFITAGVGTQHRPR